MDWLFYSVIVPSILLGPCFLMIGVHAYREINRTTALRSHLFLITILAVCWLAMVVLKVVVLDTMLPPMDGVRHEYWAREIAEELQHGQFDLAREFTAPGNRGYRLIEGVFYAVTNSPQVVVYAINGLFAFMGLLRLLAALCTGYRLQRIPVPDVLLTFLLPSVIFWTTCNLKEGVMLWSICEILRYAVLSMSDDCPRPSFPMFASFLGLLFRPHIGVALLASLAFGLSLKGKQIFVPVICVCGILLGGGILSFLKPDLVKSMVNSGMTETLNEHYLERNSLGGSAIGGTPIPFVSGGILLLFRPFPREVANASQALAGIEIWFVTGLAALLWLRSYNLNAMLRDPFTLTTLALLVCAAFFFSYMYNMGLMVRQRAQFMPVLLVLCFIPRWAGLTLPGPSKSSADSSVI